MLTSYLLIMLLWLCCYGNALVFADRMQIDPLLPIQNTLPTPKAEVQNPNWLIPKSESEQWNSWPTSELVWIKLTDWCLDWVGKDCFKMDKLLWVKEKPDDNKTVISVVQDLILAATWAVWTVLTLVLIYCGVMYIIASGWDSWKASKLKKWMIDAWIWALLVRCAYGIVRLIQYIAQW